MWTVFGQGVIKQIAVALIDRDIRRLPLAAGDDLLHQTRRADVSERAARPADSRIDALPIPNLRRNENITDAFARQRQRLGIGIADDRVVVFVDKIRHFHAVVNDLAIRLVADQKDRMAIFGLFFAEQITKRANAFRRIDNARWVVRRVDDDALGMRIDGGSERVHVDLECVFFRGVRRSVPRLRF